MNSPNEKHLLSAAEAARQIASGNLTSEALVTACLERLAAINPTLEAWTVVDGDAAIRQARALDQESPRGPLHGIPVGIKDLIDTADMATAYGSPIYEGHRPKWDAACVTQLKMAGCVILGKTVTTEFANIHPSRTRNPHDIAHTPGGSSSGSAAAVASYMVPLALGTQTAGSTIRPAAFCGVVGHKPSFNTINRAGLKFIAESQDTIGIIGRSAEDVMLCAHVLSGSALPRLGDGTGRHPRIGLCRTPRWHEADRFAQECVESVAGKLSKAGGVVEEFLLPAGSERLFDEHARIMAYETARALAWEYVTHAEKLSPTLRARLGEGWSIPREVYESAREHGRLCRRHFMVEYAVGRYDFLLTLSAPGEAPRDLATTGNAVFNRLWTLFGGPCVTVPAGKGERGLPLGVQLVGRHGADHELLAWAHWVEKQLA